MKINQKQFDVVVIGGGPAGIMAAGRAAELGAKVLLVEKNKELGRKLLITGKGRCNITQEENNPQEFARKLGKNGKFLFSSFSSFGPQEIIQFFQQRNLQTKTERGGRVFPVSNNALNVLDVLKKYLLQNKVELATGAKVLDFSMKGQRIESVKISNEKIHARIFILCTGGKSYPATGSTGDGYIWAKKFGHRVTTPTPALVPVCVNENWIKDLQGLSLKNIQINIFQQNKKWDSRFGEMVFTHFGLSGPIVLDMSKKIGQLLTKGKVFAEIDLKPALDFTKLDNRLQRDFLEQSKKDFKNYLPSLVPKKLIAPIISLSKIKPDKKLHSIDKQERKDLVRLLKGLRFEIGGLMGFDQAIITSGGVDTKEVDPKTMRSRKVENLFFAGEILDLDGPTGGFNLQICWSTGFAAGTYSAKN